MKWISLLLFILLMFISNQSGKAQTWKVLLEKADKFNSVRQSDSAIIVGRKALQQAKREFGEIDTSVALCLHRLGAYHHAFLAANEDSFYLAALSVWEKIPTANPLLVARTLNNLGTFYGDVGKYERSEHYHRRTIELKEKFGTEKDQLSLAVSYHNLGSLYRGMGKFDLAEEYLKRALSIRERKLTIADAATGNTINVLAVMYQQIGNYKKAKELYGRVLDSQAKTAQDTIYRVGYIANLGNLCLEEGFYASADSLFRVALSIQENPQYYNQEIKIELLNSLSEVLTSQGNIENAGRVLEEALRLTGTSRNIKPVLESLTLSNLGKLAFYDGNLVRAESLFQQSLGIRKQFLGERNSTVANAISDLAANYRAQGKLRSAIEYSLEAMRSQNRVMDMLAQTMVEKDVLAYIANNRRAVNVYLSSFVDSLKRTAIRCEEAAGIVLQNKGALAERMFQRQQAMVAQSNPGSRALIEDYRDVQYQLSRLFVHGSKSESTPQRKSLEDSLSKRFDALESAIARKDKTFNRNRENNTLSLKSVNSVLPANAVLVEYLKYEYIPSDLGPSTPHYLAVVLQKGKQCKVTDLGESFSIDNDIVKYRAHLLNLAQSNQPLTNDKQKEYEAIAGNLYRRIWSPVSTTIAKGATVIIAADAGLNLVSFSGLLDEQSKYLIEKHPIHYVSAGRDLVRLKDSQKPGKGLIAFGDPDYDSPAALRKNSNSSSESIASSTGNEHQVRNVRSGCGVLSTTKVQSLPGTRAEVNALTRPIDRKPPLLFLGADASEENFKSAVTGHRYVHAATHGYFLEGSCLSGTDPRRNEKLNLLQENPLLQSGIFLAGANLHGEKGDSGSAEDGILTALEVSGMDLRGTELVVLSACETGLGKIEQGEGVYGLRRSFQMAGARTILSSLWQIPDDETRKFMKDLYSQQASTYPELLQKVSIRRITELKKRGRPAHPYFWAGFVATGDWKIK